MQMHRTSGQVDEGTDGRVVFLRSIGRQRCCMLLSIATIEATASSPELPPHSIALEMMRPLARDCCARLPLLL
jgi:hypothetical protein